MKRMFFRMSRGFILPMLFVFVLAFFCYFSIVFSRSSERAKTRWNEYRVEPYSLADDSLQMQVDKLEERLSFLNSIFSEVSDYFYEKEDYFFEISTINKSIRVLQYLKEKQIPYEDVIEGSFIFSEEKSQIAYSDYIVGYLFYLNIILGAFLVYQTVIVPKVNGSIVLDIILYGRKRMFFSQLGIVASITGSFVVLEYLLTILFRTQFSKTGKYMLYATNDAIIIKNEFVGFSLSMLFVLVTCMGTVLIEFALSQIINASFFYFLSCAVLTLLYVDFVNMIPTESSLNTLFICGFGYRFVLQDEVFGVTVGNMIKIAAAAGLVGISYMVARKKNYRQIYI